MKGVFVTCNTDAGYFTRDKVGSYAYWIKATGLHLHGSGLFKNKCAGPWQAEMQAMINALHVLKQAKPPPIIRFIFNRDNINARSGSKGNHLRQDLKEAIAWFKKDAIERLGIDEFRRLTVNQKNYAEFRHVKSHDNTDTKRNWVNDWCDRQCKARLIEWLKKQKVHKNEAK